MPIIRTGESDYDKEMRKWDLPKHMGGYNANGFEKYPQSLYKAYRNSNGKAMCRDLRGLYSSDPAIQAESEAFNRRCELVVKSEEEYQRATRDGWRDTQQEALDLFEDQQRDIAQAAAEAAYSVQRMTEKARAEYEAHDKETEAPAVDVPAPAKKRGRKPNNPMVTVS